MKILAAGGELLGRGVLEVPELVLHAAVELLRVLLALEVKLDADRRVHAHREVVVDYVVRYAVLVRLFLFRLMIRHFDLPSVHHHRCRLFDFLLGSRNNESVSNVFIDSFCLEE